MPAWSGEDGEWAILVRRREPDGTNLQMEQDVAAQVSDYLLHFSKFKVSNLLAALATQMIAQDYIAPEGSHHVMLTREQLMAFAVLAQAQLRSLEADHAGK